MILTKKIFLASSSELKEDRREFEILISRKNKDWISKGVFLELIVWEDFLDALSKTRLQDEYNNAIRSCDVFVMLFFTKVGRYTEEEFDAAFGNFKATNKPYIFTYFKTDEIGTDSSGVDLMSLQAFQEKLKTLGHFYTVYKNIDALQLHFVQQLDKLVANGFIEFDWDKSNAAVLGPATYEENLTGIGAIKQGRDTVTIGPGAVHVGESNTGNINTGTQVSTHGDQTTMADVAHALGRGAQSNVTLGISTRDLESLFALLLTVVLQHTATDKQASAMQQVQDLKIEVAKGTQADDSRIGKLIDSLVNMIPAVSESIVIVFSTPMLDDIAGPVTKFVLDKLNQNRNTLHG